MPITGQQSTARNGWLKNAVATFNSGIEWRPCYEHNAKPFPLLSLRKKLLQFLQVSEELLSYFESLERWEFLKRLPYRLIRDFAFVILSPPLLLDSLEHAAIFLWDLEINGNRLQMEPGLEISEELVYIKALKHSTGRSFCKLCRVCYTLFANFTSRDFTSRDTFLFLREM